MPNGVVSTYQYDGLDRLTRLTHAKGATSVADFQYQFNAVNNITQMIDSAGAHNYTYDSLDRLTAATHPSQANESYTYDDVGNRTASQQGSSYTYQAFNRLTAANGNSYGYDANGNLTSKTDATGSWAYGWDYENRLKTATLAGGVAVTYSYDALGRRILRSDGNGGTSKFVYDGADVVRDLNANLTTAADYLNGLGVDNKLRQSVAGTAAYFIQDQLGTTRSLTDASGSITSSLSYDSFGNVTSGSASTRYSYTGRESDFDTGLMYYRARGYDARQGRFMSEDPARFRGGVNLYGYVGNDPTKFSDPSGLERLSTYTHTLPPQPTPLPMPKRDCGCSIRRPDFYQMQFNFSVPFTRGWGSYSPSLEIDRYGNMYSSFRGAGAGPSWKVPGASVSVTAGWLFNQPPQGPDENTIKNFSTASSLSAGGGYWLGSFVSHSPNGPTALQLGFVSPQAGCGYAYSDYDGNVADLPGPSRLAEDIENLYGRYPQ